MIGDIVAQRLLAEFEPQLAAIRFDSAQVGAILRSVRRSRGDEILFSSGAKARWDFLEAARRYLGSLTDREELLVAFGTKGGPSRRARSYLTSFVRSVGTERQVALDPQLHSGDDIPSTGQVISLVWTPDRDAQSSFSHGGVAVNLRYDIIRRSSATSCNWIGGRRVTSASVTA